MPPPPMRPPPPPSGPPDSSSSSAGSSMPRGPPIGPPLRPGGPPPSTASLSPFPSASPSPPRMEAPPTGPPPPPPRANPPMQQQPQQQQTSVTTTTPNSSAVSGNYSNPYSPNSSISAFADSSPPQGAAALGSSGMYDPRATPTASSSSSSPSPHRTAPPPTVPKIPPSLAAMQKSNAPSPLALSGGGGGGGGGGGMKAPPPALPKRVPSPRSLSAAPGPNSASSPTPSPASSSMYGDRAPATTTAPATPSASPFVAPSASLMSAATGGPSATPTTVGASAAPASFQQQQPQPQQQQQQQMPPPPPPQTSALPPPLSVTTAATSTASAAPSPGSPPKKMPPPKRLSVTSIGDGAAGGGGEALARTYSSPPSSGHVTPNQNPLVGTQGPPPPHNQMQQQQQHQPGLISAAASTSSTFRPPPPLVPRPADGSSYTSTSPRPSRFAVASTAVLAAARMSPPRFSSPSKSAAAAASSPLRVKVITGPPPANTGAVELGASGEFASDGFAFMPPKVTRGAPPVFVPTPATSATRFRDVSPSNGRGRGTAASNPDDIDAVRSSSSPFSHPRTAGGVSAAAAAAAVVAVTGKMPPSVPRTRPSPSGTPMNNNNNNNNINNRSDSASPLRSNSNNYVNPYATTLTDPRLQSVSPASSPINFNNASPQPTSSLNRAALPPGGGGDAFGTSGAAVPPKYIPGPGDQAVATANRGPVKNAPPKMDPSKLRPQDLQTTMKAPGARPAAAAGPALIPATSAAPPTVGGDASTAAAAAGPPSSSQIASSQSAVGMDAVVQYARLAVPVSADKLTGDKVPVPGNTNQQQQQRPHHLSMGNPNARPVSLAISSDEDDDDDATIDGTAAHADASSNNKSGANSLRRALVVVRPATTAPAVPLWVQHVAANNASLHHHQQQHQQQYVNNPNPSSVPAASASALTPSRAIMSPLSAASRVITSGGADASGSGGAAASDNNNLAVRSFVLHHFGKKTQGLLHDIFRTLVHIGQNVDGAAAQQPLVISSTSMMNSIMMSSLANQQQQQQQQQQSSKHYSPQLVCTFSATICFIAMALRMHDRHFAMQHALLLSFASAATGGISAEAYMPIAALDVETWVNTLVAVLDNTRTSTTHFASALLDEDLSVPNYVAHARAAGRHDAYLELTLPEVLARTQKLANSPWCRLTMACYSPEVMTAVSQRHATIAALFDRFGSHPNALNQRVSAMLSPVQQQRQSAHIMAQESKSHLSNPMRGPQQQQQCDGYPPLAIAAWEMTTPRSRASAAVLPQDAFPVPHLMVTIGQARKMLECSGSSETTPVMPAILTVSGFKQIIETVSIDAPGVALNFSEFQLFMAIVSDRCCKFEDATSFDSGINAPPANMAGAVMKIRPLQKAIAGKIHHLVQFLAA